jgi:ATP-dependent Clp protease adapter protein ClpS
MSQTIELPVESINDTPLEESWVVVVYNNDYNTYDEVMIILMVATHCGAEEAEIETWEIDRLGKSVVHHGGKEECEEVAKIIRQIGIQVEVFSE